MACSRPRLEECESRRLKPNVSKNWKSTTTNTETLTGMRPDGSTRRCASDRPVAIRGVVECGGVGAAGAGTCPVMHRGGELARTAGAPLIGPGIQRRPASSGARRGPVRADEEPEHERTTCANLPFEPTRHRVIMGECLTAQRRR